MRSPNGKHMNFQCFNFQLKQKEPLNFTHRSAKVKGLKRTKHKRSNRRALVAKHAIASTPAADAKPENIDLPGRVDGVPAD